MILLVDSEGPDQTVDRQMLKDKFWHGTAHIIAHWMAVFMLVIKRKYQALKSFFDIISRSLILVVPR